MKIFLNKLKNQILFYILKAELHFGILFFLKATIVKSQQILRYNDYTRDEFSRCNCTPPYSAEAAISARGDLNPANGTYPFSGMGHVNHGALDYKVKFIS